MGLRRRRPISQETGRRRSGLPNLLLLSLLIPLSLIPFLLAPALAPTPPGHRGGSTGPAAPAPSPDRRRVLIVTADGARPDLLLRARAPHVRSLLARGAFTFWARTVPECYTLPAHVSIVTGVTPQRHGVTWNDHIEEAYPQVPTLFTLAKRAGRTTALATGKTKFVALTPPESLDWRFQPMDEPIADAEVARHACDILREHRPDLLFVHFPGADEAGHAHGWGSAEQVNAIERVDAALGQVLATLDSLNLRDSTLVLFTADHGGAARDHGPDDPRSRHVPWVAAGPGVRRNHDLTLTPSLDVRVEDTFATACAFLGIDPPADVDGQDVAAIYEPPAELLRPVTR